MKETAEEIKERLLNDGTPRPGLKALLKDKEGAEIKKEFDDMFDRLENE